MKIPTYTPDVSPGIPKYNLMSMEGISQITEGLSKAGSAMASLFGELARKREQADDLNNFIDLYKESVTSLEDITSTAVNKIPHEEREQYFQKAWSEAEQNILSKARNDNVRMSVQRFMVLRTIDSLHKVKEQANKDRIKTAIASIETGLDGLKKDIYANPTFDNYQAVIRQGNELIDNAIAAGIMDPKAAEAARITWGKHAALVMAGSLINKARETGPDAIREIHKLLSDPKTLPELDPEGRNRMLDHIRQEADRLEQRMINQEDRLLRRQAADLARQERAERAQERETQKDNYNKERLQLQKNILDGKPINLDEYQSKIEHMINNNEIAPSHGYTLLNMVKGNLDKKLQEESRAIRRIMMPAFPTAEAKRRADHAVELFRTYVTDGMAINMAKSKVLDQFKMRDVDKLPPLVPGKRNSELSIDDITKAKQSIAEQFRNNQIGAQNFNKTMDLIELILNSIDAKQSQPANSAVPPQPPGGK